MSKIDMGWSWSMMRRCWCDSLGSTCLSYFLKPFEPEELVVPIKKFKKDGN